MKLLSRKQMDEYRTFRGYIYSWPVKAGAAGSFREMIDLTCNAQDLGIALKAIAEERPNSSLMRKLVTIRDIMIGIKALQGADAILEDWCARGILSRRKAAPETKVGDKFQLIDGESSLHTSRVNALGEHRFFILVQTYVGGITEHIALANMATGMLWNSPVRCEDLQDVSRKEFDQAAYGGVWEKEE